MNIEDRDVHHGRAVDGRLPLKGVVGWLLVVVTAAVVVMMVVVAEIGPR